MFKTFRLPNSFQIDGPINEMLFSPKLLFLKDISKVICDLVLYMFLDGTNSSFAYSNEVTFKYLKTFVAIRFCTSSFVGRKIISLIS